MRHRHPPSQSQESTFQASFCVSQHIKERFSNLCTGTRIKRQLATDTVIITSYSSTPASTFKPEHSREKEQTTRTSRLEQDAVLSDHEQYTTTAQYQLEAGHGLTLREWGKLPPLLTSARDILSFLLLRPFPWHEGAWS